MHSESSCREHLVEGLVKLLRLLAEAVELEGKLQNELALGVSEFRGKNHQVIKRQHT